MLSHSAATQGIIRQLIKDGKPLPEWYTNAPTLPSSLNLYLQAFFDLDSERSYGFGPGPIPWGAIAGYASIYKFDEEQSANLVYYIKRMDAAFLKYQRDKTDKEKAAKK